MVGDPSGRTDMRKMLTQEEINDNAEKFKVQFQRLIDFSDDKAIMDNNANWLLDLNYVNFLREIGVHFSVNRMLTAECYKSRLEKGLTFIEFNYMLMQSYDFLELYRRYGCKLQMGGDDQWSNIISGVDLVRRVENADVFGMTFTLLTTSDGRKMGKTQAGAVWLDPDKTSSFDFYQYWRNIDDADVEKCLALLTFLPMEEVRRLGSLPGQEINEAKKVLAFEVTKLVHGEEEAQKAQNAAEALFGGGGNMDLVPSTEVDKKQIEEGLNIVDMLVLTKLVSSKGEGRRLINQGGLLLNDEKIESIERVVSMDDIKDDEIMLKKGKKTYHRVIIK